MSYKRKETIKEGNIEILATLYMAGQTFRMAGHTFRFQTHVESWNRWKWIFIATLYQNVMHSNFENEYSMNQTFRYNNFENEL